MKVGDLDVSGGEEMGTKRVNNSLVDRKKHGLVLLCFV